MAMPLINLAQDTIKPLAYYRVWSGWSNSTYDLVDSIKNMNATQDSTVFELHTYRLKEFAYKNTFTFKNGQVIRHKTDGFIRHVVFDYNLGQGDTFNYYDGVDSIQLVIDTIFQISLDNREKRMAYAFTATHREFEFWRDSVVWIKGFGSINDGYDLKFNYRMHSGGTRVISACLNDESVYWMGHDTISQYRCDFNQLDSYYVGVQEFEKHGITVEFYPNPSTGTFNIDGNPDAEVISVFNAQGQQVEFLQDQNQLIIDAKNEGIYWVMLRSEKAILTRKVVVR
ncbi:MAG: T9SS type A sorting domain-containing protein [Bacteroidetes bacterium]|nr:T9SS type A sorting domain-containing protein [Bacteroidota bacterium]